MSLREDPCPTGKRRMSPTIETSRQRVLQGNERIHGRRKSQIPACTTRRPSAKCVRKSHPCSKEASNRWLVHLRPQFSYAPMGPPNPPCGISIESPTRIANQPQPFSLRAATRTLRFQPNPISNTWYSMPCPHQACQASKLGNTCYRRLVRRTCIGILSLPSSVHTRHQRHTHSQHGDMSPIDWPSLLRHPWIYSTPRCRI